MTLIVLISCRYYEEPLETYKTNLDVLFRRLKVVLGPQCLLLWTMTMPVGYRDYEMPENVRHNLREDIVEGNFFSAVLADFHRLDVLDMHYHFRWKLHLRWHDAVHWNQIAHRKYTQILLSHIAQAWGVEAPKFKMPKGFSGHSAPPHPFALRGDPYPGPYPTIQGQERCNQALFPFGTDIPQMPDTMTPGFFGPPGFNGHFAPPHPFALRGDPYPGPHPSIQEQERCTQAPFPFGTDGPLLTADIGHNYFSPQGFSGHSAPPHPFALRGDPYPGPHPSIQEQERCTQGFTVHSAPPPPYAGPHLEIQDQEHHNSGPFPFMTDGPQPSDTMEGFFLPPPGPEVFSHPFPGRKVLLSTPSLMNLNVPFPNHAPYSQKPLKKKMKRRRGKMKPNPCPP
ncbi:PC-esterase domain-containing protein 1A-like [Hyla sarda]|uniref:PC-esterase domain-containing protein 1A-like n=1 Tax=Hyla sarda TaxID=327740 RepID=UPI0024C2C286|nr:PC-esterase domain-containing protein 1A-like [Hyla sarda]